ncbi:MAG TPA: BTAD domain-containing putative transcriptional regulator, partial [Longimicrobiales bacterium]
MSLRLLTFGRLQVFSHGRELTEMPAQRLRCAILVYLLMERDVKRETLLGLFWPDRTPQRARHALSQTLYELRRSLGEEWLVLSGDRLRVQAGQVEVDAYLFEECAPEDPDTALELYRGAFLEDFSPEIRGLEPWLEAQRARFARLHRKLRREAMQRLVKAGELTAAHACARRWVELEPFDDEAQHRLVELLATLGQRTEAIQHFESYQRRLREELDVEPLDETRALVASLREGTAAGAGAGASAAAESEAVPSAAGRLAALLPPDGAVDRPAAAFAAGGPAVRRHVWRRRLAWAAVPVLLAGLLLWLGSRLHTSGDPAQRPAASLRSMAVLVFDDDSPDRHLGFLARGLTKHLIYELSQVSGLDVVSFNGVAPLEGKAIAPDSIRRLLNVGSFLDGTVQEAGGRLSVMVSLTDAATGRVLRTAELQRPKVDALSLEDDLAEQVSKLIRPVLGRELALQEHRAHARNGASWTLWLQADQLRDRALGTNEPGAPPGGPLVTGLLDSADSLAAEAEQQDRGWVEPLLLRGWLAVDRARAEEDGSLPVLRTGLDYADKALARAPDLPRAYELRGTLRLALARAELGVQGPLLDSAESDLRTAVVREPSLAGAWATL